MGDGKMQHRHKLILGLTTSHDPARRPSILNARSARCVHAPASHQGNNAFQRLLTDLIKISPNETILAHSGANIFADGLEGFTAARHLKPILNHFDLHTHQISDRSLRIHMKIHSPEPTRHFGILNVRVINNWDYYYAIPLKRHSDSTAVYICVNGKHQSIHEDIVKTLPVTKILILLRPPRATETVCSLERRDHAELGFSLFAHGTTRLSGIGDYACVNMLLDPRRSNKSEVLEYIFGSTRSDSRTEEGNPPAGRSFALVVVFDPEENIPGVLVEPLTE